MKEQRVRFLEIVGVLLLAGCVLSGILILASGSSDKEKTEVVKELSNKGFSDIQIIGSKPMRVFTKKARLVGVEFTVQVVNTKDNKVEKFFVFYRSVTGDFMFFNLLGDRIFLD